MQRMTSRELGDYGEALAARYLVENGFVVLDRNWRCGRGEIDIVAIEGAHLVVCEVKTRSNDRFGAPFEAVGRHKALRLRVLAGLWVEQRSRQVAWPGVRRGVGALRLDVVSILRPADRPASVTHLRGVQ